MRAAVVMIALLGLVGSALAGYQLGEADRIRRKIARAYRKARGLK
jgi:hypothetical protein